MSLAIHSEPRRRQGDYGFDAPRQGLLPAGAGGLLLAGLAAIQKRRGHRRAAAAELLGSGVLLLTFAI